MPDTSSWTLPGESIHQFFGKSIISYKTIASSSSDPHLHESKQMRLCYRAVGQCFGPLNRHPHAEIQI